MNGKFPLEWRIDFYAVLGIEYSATDNDICRAHRDKIKHSHPDLFSDPNEKAEANEKSTILNMARETLLDSELRLKYDLYKGFARSSAGGTRRTASGRPNDNSRSATRNSRPAGDTGSGGGNTETRQADMDDHRGFSSTYGPYSTWQDVRDISSFSYEQAWNDSWKQHHDLWVNSQSRNRR